MLQGSTLQPSNMELLCDNATDNLFNSNDICSRAVLELFINDNDTVIGDLFYNDCPTRFHDYVTACSLDDVSTHIE